MPTKNEKIQQLRSIADSKPESRSRRVQLLIAPSLYDEIKVMADESGVSVNEVINAALNEYVAGK